MFYSHQLLARKTPLGQIWMAATMHAKIDRRKLDKINIINICEEILNPSVPMALRLSGILMGGVVIVYERKVKLLCDDAKRFLINETLRVKQPSHDPTVLPKSRNHAKYETVTLPDVAEMEIEQGMMMSNSTATTRVKYQRKGFHMQLDALEDEYIQIDPKDSAQSQYHHQADPQNITLFDDIAAENDMHNRFERFDIDEDDDETMFYFSKDQPQEPFTIIPSPPAEVLPQQVDEFMRDHNMERQGEQSAEELRRRANEGVKDEQRPKRRTSRAKRKSSTFILDNDQLIIPGSIYQTWLQDTSAYLRKRQRVIKPINPVLSGKIAFLMELPFVVLPSCIQDFAAKIYYPAQLMEQWKNITREQTESNCPSGGKSDNQEGISHTPPPDFFNQDHPEFPAENLDFEMGSQTLPDSIEKIRGSIQKMNVEGSRGSSGFGHSGGIAASNPSSGSVPRSPFSPEVPIVRTKRKQNSSSANSFGNLDPVEEDFPLVHKSRDFMLGRVCEGPTPDLEILEETGPTQTPHHMIVETHIDKITQTIRTHLKVHFNTPGAPVSESLDQLAYGMNRKKAAQLFYQTCVLANCDYIKVDQERAYGDISISKGPKM